MSVGSANLAARIFAAAAERGWDERVALREPNRHWTYVQLEDQARRVATALATLRIQPGERVAVFMPDSLEMAASLLGVIYAGAVAVPLSELATANDVRDYCTDSGAIAAIVSSHLEPALDEIRTEVPQLREVLCVGPSSPGERDFFALVRGASPAAAPADTPGETHAMILYSAGTTEPRGVPHTHDTPFVAMESFAQGVLGLSEDDRVFSVMRMSTAYGLGTGLLFPLMLGAEAMLLPGQPRSEAVLGIVESFRPTALFATPSVYGQLARDAETAHLLHPLRDIRACVSGAEGMPPQLVTRVRDVLGAEVLVGYGLTEAFQFVLATRPGQVVPGSCGQVVPGFRARIVNKNGAEIGPDEIGTLEIQGATVFGDYWHDGDDQSTDTGRIGWYRTRDRFMRDSDGYFYHCGRVDGLFKVGGKWVSPAEVEQALLGHEAVWECAVIGADDTDGLIKPLAFVVPNIGHAPSETLAAELREHVKHELAPYKYPRWIEFVDELPKGPQGKILRYKLKPPPLAKRRAETAGA